ncbi:MAG TPA: nickel-responsive regulator 1 [Thermoplasmata archaeon]|jgi:CopG family nickel-responsive transcriptional regulator|nr:nickel-responsive regulator 1 [Thermoplasmata archaeon]
MSILSVSMPDSMLRTMRELQKSQGFSGNSELVRTALRLLLADAREKESLTGPTDAVIVVTHREEREEPVTRIKHRFDDVVKTHIHNKAGKGTCVEVFLVEGDGSKAASMAKAFQREDGIKAVKMLVL